MTDSVSRPNVIILLAPAAGGKTHRLIEALVGDRSEIRPRWAVLPDRTQVASFRRRIAEAGGALGVSVGTFGDLFQEILARARIPVAVTPAPARQRLLRLALRRLEAGRRLPHYDPIVRTPGFLEIVAEAIAELKRAQVGPEALEALAGALESEARSGATKAQPAPSTPQIDAAAALADLARIYAEYERRLAAIPWTDREGLNQLAVRALVERPELLADMPLIAVDGFDSFEPAQLAALAAFSASVEQLIVTLPGDSTMQRAAFRRFAIPLERLKQTLPEGELVELAPPGAGTTESAGGAGAAVGADQTPSSQESRDAFPIGLVRLEAGLFERSAQPFDPGPAIEMIEARGPVDEAREALRWLKARLVRDGLAMEDCALVVPDSDRYAPALQRAAAEYGLRLRFTHGEPLAQAPAVAALLDLLELPRANWPRRLVLQAVRSPFFALSRWGLEPADALVLDAASHVGQVVEGLEQWEQALAQLAEAELPPELELLEEELPAFAAPAGAAAARLWEALAAFSADLSPSGARTTASWVAWLENLLDELKFAELAAGEDGRRQVPTPDMGPAVSGNGTAEAGTRQREEQAFERLRETLRALLLGEVVSGQLQLSYGEFLEEFEGAVESASYRDRLSSEPAIPVLGPLQARGGRYRAVAVLGLSEGLLPEIEREDPFLGEATRRRLGLQPRLGREQAGLFYQALSRADGRLLLTRPYLAEDGEAWEASPFWREVERLLEADPQRIRPVDARPLQEAGSPGELLFWGVRRGGMPASLLEPHRHRWEELQHGRDVLAARAAAAPSGPFEGDLAVWRDELLRRFGPDHLWSPSRLETYGACPHMFFATHLLSLETREPPEPGLDAAQLGSILHEILESAYAAAERPDDLDSVLEALDVVAGPILDRAPQRHGFRPTPLWEIERSEHRQALRETVRALAELSQNWTPIGFELAFGLEGQPALRLELPAFEGEAEPRAARLRGLIDRLDRRADGKLRVIDYKTGRSRLGVGELHQGRRIQLPLYALAAQEALGLGEVVDGFYWAILAAERGSLRLSNYRPPIEGLPSESPAESENGTERPVQVASGDAATPSIPGSGPSAAYAVARAHVSRIVHGVQSAQFPPVPPPGGCPEYCPAAAWCWRYQPAGWG